MLIYKPCEDNSTSGSNVAIFFSWRLVNYSGFPYLTTCINTRTPPPPALKNQFNKDLISSVFNIFQLLLIVIVHCSGRNGHFTRFHNEPTVIIDNANRCTLKCWSYQRVWWFSTVRTFLWFRVLTSLKLIFWRLNLNFISMKF